MLTLGAAVAIGETKPAGADSGRGMRLPAVAGAFYPAERAELERMVVSKLLAAAPGEPRRRLLAAVAPHAGYVFSGDCAAALYTTLSGQPYDRVIVLGPSHYGRFTGVAVPGSELTGWRTPLGTVRLDAELRADVAGKPGFTDWLAAADRREHSIEVQVPFLQCVLTNFAFLPLLCGRLDEEAIESCARALAPWMHSNTLLIASSDFTHYGANYGFMPFTTNIRDHLYEWLDGAAGRVAALDEAGFREHLRTKGDTICGEGPIRLLMATLRLAGTPVAGSVLKRYTSGDVVGDFQNSVSYAAIGFFGMESAPDMRQKEAAVKEHRVKEHRSGRWSPELSDEEQSTLYGLVMDTLEWCVRGRRGAFAFDRYTLTPNLRREMATFVTLKKDGRLRGCIGSLEAEEPLYLSAHHNAINAALRDPRFPPVRPEELEGLSVDVSILSPLRDIGSPAEFRIGEQGVILEKGFHRAVYLPEVALEQGWTMEETLSSLSMKAGLPPDAWRQGCSFKVFESVVLSR